MKLFFLIFVICFSSSQAADSFFELRSKLSYLPEVVRIADLVILDKDFQKEIEQIESFKDSKENGYQVVSKMLSPIKAVVSSYKSKNPYSSTTAYTVEDRVYFNTRNNPRRISEMVNTAIHERLHVLNYHHKGNSWRKNQDTVPYKVGNISEKYVIRYITL